ncbi:MAG: pyridoxal-phosphate dependent enzyme [Treponema sp.]|nr:pyridoxal-phosphate dependent enzyme [Treponema sp.]
MDFVSTRNKNLTVNFEKAVINCLPEDGGLYVPHSSPDLRKWILYTGETTTFASIAGTLTNACVNDEFSPVICETIATKAFPFEPVLKRLDSNLFALELFNTPTGSHKDFGISYIVSCLETILTMKDQNAVFLDASIGELGCSLARAIRGKKHLKAVLVYPKGMVRGLNDEDFVWNGGNVYPVEVDGTENDCHELVRKIFNDTAFSAAHNLTVANTANIGRLLPQMFFYPFAFSRLKKTVSGDIFYAMSTGNYSNLTAGLYTWKLSLPLSGFICPATDEIKVSPSGECEIMDSMVDFLNRGKADPASPSNLERLEDIFHRNSLMLKNLVYPAEVSAEQKSEACRELYMKYNISADSHTSSAWAAAKSRHEVIDDEDETVVLVMRDHPALDSGWIKHNTGFAPEMPQNVRDALKPVNLNRKFLADADELRKIIESVC